MVTLCVVLLILGLAGLTAEMFIPGFGVFGISGIVSLVLAAVLAVIYVPNGWFFVTAEVVLIAVALYCFFTYIRKKQLHGKLFMNETLAEDTPQIGDLNSFIGREGMTLTSLRPFGDVDFNGIRIEVSSSGPWIEPGTKVRVAETRGNKLIVCALQANEN